MRKIAIMYICIGKYSVMWQAFYESAQRFLFNNDSKHFFVFTDSEEILNSFYPDVTTIRESNYGWPGNTLYRFKMFSSISETIESYDYAYFFNANACFVKPVSDEVLPKDGSKIVVAQHFKMSGLNPLKYAYDRNAKSTAYVKWGHEGKDYIQACLFGATGSEFSNLSNIINKNIKQDEKHGVVALWHDESHLNKYIIGKKYTLLPISYVYPEVLSLPGEINILMRNKEKFASLNTLRYSKKSIIRNLVEKTYNQFRKLKGLYYYLTISKLKRIK